MTETKHRGWQRILSIVLPYLILVGIFYFIGASIAGIDITDEAFKKTTFQQVVMSFFNLLGTFLILWIFMNYVDKERFIQLGFQTKNRGIDFIFGIGLGLLILGLGYGLLIYMKEIFIVKIIFDPEELILVVIHFTIVAIVEEALCRGYILKNLMVSFNKYVALIVSSLIFSFLHYFNPNIDFIAITDLFFAGILLGISYIYTKNLWFPIALHLSWNLFQTLLGFNVSGQDSYSIIEIDIHQANLLNGGAFGFEGSILAIVAQLFAIIGIAVYYNRKNTNHNKNYNLTAR